jgi:putative ABC transport system permease protein
VLHLVIGSLRADVRRLVSTTVAICLGVALLAGTLVFSDTLRSSFDQLFQRALGQADAVVRSANTLTTDGEFAQDLIPGALAADVAAVDGVVAVVPQIEGFGQLTGSDGEKIGGFGPPTEAGTWIEDEELNPYELVEGRAPAAPDEVVINRGAAEEGGLRVGDTTTVATPEPVTVRVVGIATFGGEDGLGPSTYTAFSLEGAEQHVTGRPGEVTSLLVRGDGVDEDELVERIGRTLAGGAEVISGSDLVDEANEEIGADFVGFLTTFLLVFAVVALLVATCSISNTFAILGAQRARASGLLRAVGATRRHVLLAALGEALLVGTSASLVGAAAGVGLAAGIAALFGAVGFPLPAGGLAVSPAALVVAVVVGVLVTVLGATAPAVRAARVAPLAALRAAAVDRSAQSVRRAGAGVVLLGAGVASLTVGAGSQSLTLTGLGAVATVVGAVVLGPVVARPAATVLGAPIALARGLAGVLARRNAVRSPRRTAASASALMIGIGVVTLFTVLAGSLKTSVDDGVGAVVHGDLVIAASQFGGGGLSPGLADAVAGVPGVAGAVGVGTGPVAIEGRTRQVSVLDPSASAGLLVPEAVEGRVDDLDASQLAVDRPLAQDEGWTLGDRVDVRFGDGETETLTIGAVYEPSSTLRDLIVPAGTWRRHQVQAVDNLVVIGLEDGADREQTRQAIEEATADFAPPDVTTIEQFVDDSTAFVDQMLGLVYAMLVLAIVIAVMGIATTLSLSIHERTRELGVVRAVGASKAQVRSMVRWESVVIAALGTASGIALGLLLGWALVEAAGSGDMVVQPSIPVGQVVVIGVVGALTGVAAAWRPARRASRIDVIDALAAA